MNNNINEPIRIAHVIGKLSNGGVESVINNYYRNIDHSKFQFDFIIDEDSTSTPPQENIDLGARYYVVPPYQSLFKHLKALTKLFKENHYQIVHVSMNTISVFALYAAWKAKVPVRIDHNHSSANANSEKKEKAKTALKYILRPFGPIFASDLFACSQNAAEWAYGNNKKVVILNNAIDMDAFKYNESIRNKIRKELKIENKFVIGHVGRFCFTKNHKFILNIYKEILCKEPESTLLLIGDGELFEETKNYAKALGIENNVIFFGPTGNVRDYYQAMDIFVLPSFYEGLPVVGVEAQAADLPCFISDVITDDVIYTDKCKKLPLEAGEKLWADEILKEKTYKRHDIPQNTKSSVFNIKTQAKNLEALYEEMLNRTNH